MTDPRREQVEKVLCIYGLCAHRQHRFSRYDADDLLNALLACFPPPRTAPDREALVAALGIDKTTVRMNIDVHQLLDVCETWASTGCPPRTREGLLALAKKYSWRCQAHYADVQFCTAGCVDILLAWANGEAERPTWCGHWKWIGGGWKTECWEATDAGMRIVFQRDWDICPVAGCHAPRPAEVV